MGCVPTAETGELGLRATVPFIDIPAAATGPAGIPGINKHQRNAKPLGFVGDKLPQLPEAPRMMLIALAFANRGPAANVRQVFQGQRSLRVFSMRDKFFSNRMVDGSSEPGFVPGHLLESPLGAPCSRGLVGLARRHTALAHHFYRGACVAIPGRIRRQVYDAQVNPQEAFRQHGRLFRGFHGYQQVEGAVNQYQIGLPLGARELHPLVVAHLHGNDEAPSQRHQADKRYAAKGHIPLVIGYRPLGAKGYRLRLVTLIGTNDLMDSKNSHLGRQAKLLPNLLIQFTLQRELRGAPFLVSVCRNPSTRGVKGMHRLHEVRVLFWRGKELGLQCCFHIDVLNQKDRTNARLLPLRDNVLSLPMPEGRGFPHVPVDDKLDTRASILFLPIFCKIFEKFLGIFGAILENIEGKIFKNILHFQIDRNNEWAKYRNKNHLKLLNI